MTSPVRTEGRDARLGRIVLDGDRVKLVFERRPAHPPERVWRALTESEQLRRWFPAAIAALQERYAEIAPASRP
jgi:uncharacterized protein YndB with AHSA1/START domain